MKKKIVWLVVSGLMVAALLLTSCAPAVVKEEEEKVAPPKEKEQVVVVPKEVVAPEKGANFIKWTGTKLDGTVVERMIEKPRYGGVHVSARVDQPPRFDGPMMGQAGSWTLGPTNDELFTKDWTRGPAGTGDFLQQGAHIKPFGELAAPRLAERWEIPDEETVIFYIRKGIHYALDPTSEASRLVGGRELTADDVVFTLRRDWSIGTHKTRAAFLADMKNVENSIYVSPTNKWAVVMKTAPHSAWLIIGRIDFYIFIYPPEPIEKYGDMNDWRRIVGTGAFLLKEYVGASSLTYVRNPNHWDRDLFFPENQLPYIDSLKILIIPDLSTRMAALRTGQIDHLGTTADRMLKEDAESLMKTNPKLEWVRYIAAWAPTIFIRNDTKPFDDVRVRQALHLAINDPEIRDLYYGGDAMLGTWPVGPIEEFMFQFIPLAEMPRSVQELYEYHPDKARQLLAEAGYPQGFKTEALVANTDAQGIELLQLIKGYWAKIGVDLKIDVREYTAITTIERMKTHKAMLMGGTANQGNAAGEAGYMNYIRPGAPSNYSIVSDPYIWKQYNAVATAISKAHATSGDKATIQAAIQAATLLNHREDVIYRVEQQYFIVLPEPYFYILWQPWLKGYNGYVTQGFGSSYEWARHVWIDQELKKAMGR